jgi:hypothetical protein
MKICWRIKRDKKTAADLKPASIIEMFISGITTKILVTDQDLADIITIAFYGGLNWCERAYPKDGHWMGNPGNHILNGGVIILCDIDGEERYELNKFKLLRGITGLIEEDNWDLSQLGFKNEDAYYVDADNTQCVLRAGHCLETGDIDADIADLIVQYGIFGKQVFA